MNVSPKVWSHQLFSNYASPVKCKKSPKANEEENCIHVESTKRVIQGPCWTSIQYGTQVNDIERLVFSFDMYLRSRIVRDVNTSVFEMSIIYFRHIEDCIAPSQNYWFFCVLMLMITDPKNAMLYSCIIGFGGCIFWCEEIRLFPISFTVCWAWETDSTLLHAFPNTLFL